MQTLCEHSCNIVIFFKRGTLKLFYELVFYNLFDHALFLKLITVLNKFPYFKSLNLNIRDCTCTRTFRTTTILIDSILLNCSRHLLHASTS